MISAEKLQLLRRPFGRVIFEFTLLLVQLAVIENNRIPLRAAGSGRQHHRDSSFPGELLCPHGVVIPGPGTAVGRGGKTAHEPLEDLLSVRLETQLELVEPVLKERGAPGADRVTAQLAVFGAGNNHLALADSRISHFRRMSQSPAELL